MVRAFTLSVAIVALAALSLGAARASDFDRNPNDWVLVDTMRFEGGTHVTRQGVVFVDGVWYSTMNLPASARQPLGRLYKYDAQGRVLGNMTFNADDYPEIPYKAHASSLDYSPKADRLYWAWMQDNYTPRGSAVTEHDPETLEITRVWDTSALATYLDAIAIDPETGDLWYSTKMVLGRVPYRPFSGFDFAQAETFKLQSFPSARNEAGSHPRLGNFSGLRVRGDTVYAFTHTAKAGWPDLGWRANNGLVLYSKSALLDGVRDAVHPYQRFYNYSFPEDLPDQEGGDIVNGFAIVSTTDERLWALELAQ